MKINKQILLFSFLVIFLLASGSFSKQSPNQPELKENREYQKGGKVMIEWRGNWYRGSILQVLGANRYKIHYDGYDHSWDEVVSDRRLKNK